MPRPFGFLLLVVLAACAPGATAGGPPAAAPTPAPLRLAEVPDQVGAFQRTESHTYPEAAAGTLYRFRGGGSLEPDVYVFPVSPDIRSRGSGPGAWAAAEGSAFPSVLAIQQQQGRFESMQVMADSAVRLTVRSVPVEGWHTAARLMVRGVPRDTHQLLFGVGDHFVKVRATFAPEAVTQAELNDFSRALLERLSAR